MEVPRDGMVFVESPAHRISPLPEQLESPAANPIGFLVLFVCGREFNMPDTAPPVALVTGGCAGLGLVITRTLVARGYRVVILDRDEERLQEACGELGRSVTGRACDVTNADQVATVFAGLDRLDVLINCVGVSDRGLIETLQIERLEELLRLNVHCTLLCSQQALKLLKESRGVIVNIGSLAAKVGARYIGAYAIAKHAVAGLTQQLRLELKPAGVHVALVSPGPIRREDAGRRYQAIVGADLPAQATKPGGGTRVKGQPPERVAAAVLRAIDKRRPDILVPGYLRILLAVGHAFPRLGDWLLLKFTSS